MGSLLSLKFPGKTRHGALFYNIEVNFKKKSNDLMFLRDFIKRCKINIFLTNFALVALFEDDAKLNIESIT